MADQFLQAPVIPDPQAGDILQAVATDAPAADFTATAEAITTADGLTSPATWQGSKTVKAEIVTEIVDKTGATAQLPPPDPAWEACLGEMSGPLVSGFPPCRQAPKISRFPLSLAFSPSKRAYALDDDRRMVRHQCRETAFKCYSNF